MTKPKIPGSSAEKIAFLGLLAVPAIVPLVLAKIPLAGQPFLTASGDSVPKFFALSAFVGVSLVAYSIALLRGELELRHTSQTWWVAGFLGLAAASTLTALDRSIAFFGEPNQMLGFLTFLLAGTVFFLSTQLVTTPQRMRGVARAVMLGGLAVATIGVLQFLQIDFLVQNKLSGADAWMNTRGASTIGNPDSAGTYLVFPLVLSVALALSESNKRWRVTAGITSVVAAAALFITLTRGAWLAAVLGLAVLGFAYFRSGGRFSRTMGVVAGVAALLIAIAAWDWGPELVRRFTDLARGSASGGGRLILWNEAARMIAAHPLFGVGADSYRYGWYPIRSLASVALQGSDTITNDPHNLALLLGATLGVPALLAAIGLLGTTLARAAKNAFARTENSDRLVFAGWWAALASFAFALFFTFNTIPATVALWLCLGVVCAPLARPVRNAPSAAKPLAIVALTLAVGMVVIAGLSLASDAALLQATTSGALATARRAVSLAPWNYDARVEETYQSGLPAVLAVQAGQANAARLVEDADRATAALVAWNPHALTGYSLRTTLLLEVAPALGDAYLVKAIETADAGLAVSPTSLELAIKKARAFNTMNRPADAASALKDLWDLDPNAAGPGVLFAEALINSKQPAKARPVIEWLTERFPDDAEVKRVGALLDAEEAAGQ